MSKKVLILGAFTVVLVIALTLFSSTTRNNIPLSDDSHLTKQQILKRIPLGTDIKTAQEVMERNGFICSLIKNREFAEDSYANGGQKYHKKADFIYCDKEKGRFFFSKRWQVAIVHKNTRVSGVLVSFGTIAP